MPMIATKAEMYTALLGGRLGNTMPNFLTLADWQKSEWADAFPMWGVRSGIAGGDKRMRLNVPTADVAALYRLLFGESGGNISPMVDEWVTLRAELCESDTEPVGLHLRYPTQVVPQNPWRGSFERHSRNVYGTEAWRVLRQHLNANSLDDLQILLAEYPGHTVELSACNRCLGAIPHRNAVIWEVRYY